MRWRIGVCRCESATALKSTSKGKVCTVSVQAWVAQERARHLHRVRNLLEREGYPRMQMGLIVALTGAAGFAASFGLLHAGLFTMALRYPLALGIAYLFFLFLIWLWLRTSASDWVDGPIDEGLPDGIGSSGQGGSSIQSGGGGDFGGGGSSGSFDLPGSGLEPHSSSDAIGAVDVDVGDELAIPLVVIALLLGMALASLYVVYIAPVLLAEVLVDWAISYALYRHLRHQERRHWLRGVIRHSIWPVVATAVFLVGMGWGLSLYAPDAKSIGEVVAHRKLDR